MWIIYAMWGVGDVLKIYICHRNSVKLLMEVRESWMGREGMYLRQGWLCWSVDCWRDRVSAMWISVEEWVGGRCKRIWINFRSITEGSYAGLLIWCWPRIYIQDWIGNNWLRGWKDWIRIILVLGRIHWI